MSTSQLLYIIIPVASFALIVIVVIMIVLICCKCGRKDRQPMIRTGDDYLDQPLAKGDDELQPKADGGEGDGEEYLNM